MGSLEEQQFDMRFVYCAACICTFLNNFDYVNKSTMKDFILNSFTYEGAFGQGSGLEAHAGYTYCAVASLSMLGELPNLDVKVKEKCLRWLSFRLLEGIYTARFSTNVLSLRFYVKSILENVEVPKVQFLPF